MDEAAPLERQAEGMAAAGRSAYVMTPLRAIDLTRADRDRIERIALELLTPKQYDAWQWSFRLNVGYRRVAGILGISRDAAADRIRKSWEKVLPAWDEERAA